MTTEFVDVTEIEGQPVSSEQLERTCHRYHWAAQSCGGLDVLEVACGSGPGLGLLRTVAQKLVAGDVSPEVLQYAKSTYGVGISLEVFGAEDLPFADMSFDRILMFEALYYVERVNCFFAEAWRVLKSGGELLIVTANKDLYDFTPSPYSRRYLGVIELERELNEAGLSPQFFGLTDTRQVPFRQRVLRPVKFMVSCLGLMPKTMRSKERFKKLFFGEMTTMPGDIVDIPFNYFPPSPISRARPDKRHKVIYCSAQKK
jgi:ubiquinone/menaquinone biosynthesis C-methylase UbiE